MKKLSLEALKQRAEATASTDLLATINGGVENSCHSTGGNPDIPKGPSSYIPVGGLQDAYQLGQAIIHLLGLD